MERPKHETERLHDCDGRYDWRCFAHKPMSESDAHFLIALSMWKWQRALYIWDWNEPALKQAIGGR